MKKMIFLYCMSLFLIPADLMYFLSSREDRKLIDEDLERYAQKEAPIKKACLRSLNYCFLSL